MLEVKNVTKTYQQGEGIFDLSFQVRPGTIMGVVGANGAGKTTLFRCIAGLFQPNSGMISIEGEHPGTEAAKHLTAYVPDQAYLFPSLTIAEHIQFKAKAFGLSSEIEESVRKALATVELTELADRTSGSLSKGQKQRVMLAAAYLHQAKLYILDEPTNGLDIPSKQWLAEWLLTQKAQNKILLVSSHSLDFIKDVADQCLLIEKGHFKGIDDVPHDKAAKHDWGNRIIQRLGGSVRLYD
ncbi:ABC transporter ATP-binding protein [Amphibacillus sediminis]|uniref:ABC transporter ATP-binding protein n=1 Tax=Amphibacillus sediminis TaxID=360185 RepID=UPI000831F400|nr:ABC transporter ATP-binding protein [Amphibacillus sediminis]